MENIILWGVGSHMMNIMSTHYIPVDVIELVVDSNLDYWGLDFFGVEVWREKYIKKCSEILYEKLMHAKVFSNRMASLINVRCNGVVAEVGVAYGDFSNTLLQELKLVVFYAIDHFNTERKSIELWSAGSWCNEQDINKKLYFYELINKAEIIWILYRWEGDY